MANFQEIKQLICDLFHSGKLVNETDDITVSLRLYGTDKMIFTIPNELIKTAFDSYTNSVYQNEKLTIHNHYYFETPVEYFPIRPDTSLGLQSVEDPVNQIEYSISNASSDYLIFLLCCIFEESKVDNKFIYRVKRKLQFHGRIIRNRIESEGFDIWKLLSELFRLRTLKIQSKQVKTFNKFRSLASSFEFVSMYRLSMPITEYNELKSIFVPLPIHSGVVRPITSDAPPQRIYNHNVIEYYMLALESRDPFTAYISYYHVIEYYFDAVFRKNLTKQIKEKITHPDFSYKNENKLYDLAKYIRKHMSSDEESGKGNELESLKYVLNEYVDIDELKTRINILSSDSVDYYQNNSVPFVTKKTTQIGWADLNGVFTTLANRIYLTRNALVHSKSEMEDNLYKPYEHRQDLIKEIPLIRAVAEQVIINSSEDI